MATAIGILGGTFNPIHIGHLRGAIEARERLGLERLVLLPAAAPPLKDAPTVTPRHRAAMVELAIRGVPGFELDDRELRREGPSYTVDTLREWRSELGDHVSLTFIMGSDSLCSLDRWSRWQTLLSLANVAILERATGIGGVPDGVSAWLEAHNAAAGTLRNSAHGRIAMIRQPPLTVSSTDLRERLTSGSDVRFLLPDPVIEYIAMHDLYSFTKAPGKP
ncbi:nicotinate-nucleotide adenylyltransferase [Luminiphilus syltensis]|uniref:nicotinate-nucleotide adenylyltransferase n=1 Tax=Luminiphilus syltensis TaxID=1341119 RepID=UPI0002F7A9FC|nr:nicotinate-nucleotide adenylyltransferase [Luminiphilus syltensis]